MLYRLVIATVRIFFKVFYRYRIFGLTHFYARPAILAANHLSFLDPPLVAVSWPAEIHFLARASLFKPFLFGRLIHAVNARPIEHTKGIAGLKASLKILKEGGQLLLFPEGSRSPNGRPQPMKQGAAYIAYQSGVPLIPVYLKGTFEAFPPHKKWPRLRGTIACVFGSPIAMEPFASLERKEALAQITECLEAAMRALETWYEGGAQGIPP